MFALISALFALSVSEEEEGRLVILNDSKFNKLVMSRGRYTVWIVMFTSNGNPTCKHVLPKFKNASEFSNGMVKFGVLDADRFPNITSQYGVQNLPHFQIFHPDGTIEYSGSQKVKDFLNFAAKYLQDASEPIKPDWKDSMLSKPSAMLFTDKQKCPAVWAGISTFFYGKSVRIGISRDMAVAEQFGVKKFPAVVFMNGTDRSEYKDAFNFRPIRAAIESFFAKKLNATEEASSPEKVFLPDEFQSECLGGREACIISVSAALSEHLMELQKQNAKHKFKWFAGLTGLPYAFIKNGIWVYNPRKDAFLNVSTEAELQTTLDRILDGTARWTKRIKLQGAPEL